MIFIKVQEEVREGIGLRIDQRNHLYSMDEYLCPFPLREISINKNRREMFNPLYLSSQYPYTHR